MLSIKENVKNELIINKSKFINYLIKIEKIDDIKFYLDKIKSNDTNATHYCYAYILGNIKHFSDDGEPGGTAGMPILNVLETNNLDYVLNIVVRYFGGIKLGAGGLVRAYTKSVTECLKKSELIEYETGYNFNVILDYSKKQLIDNISPLFIKNKVFSETITLNIECNIKDYQILKDLFERNKIEIINLQEKWVYKNQEQLNS